MSSWWDSIETLQTILPWARWSTVIATVLSAVAAASIVLLTNRIEELRQARDLPRALTEEQVAAIAKVAKQASGKKLTVQSPMFDPEADAFGTQIVGAFNSAGWLA